MDKFLSVILKAIRRIDDLVLIPLVQIIARLYLRASGVITFGDIICFGLPSVYRYPGSTIIIGKGARLRSRSRGNAIGVNHAVILRTQSANAVLKIGERTGISGASICALESITIGDDVMIGSNVVIADNDFHPLNPDERKAGLTGKRAEAVTIGDGVWVGADVYVCKGVSIGENTVIGAKSVVSKSLPPNCIAAGNPAKIIRSLVQQA